MTAPPDEPPAAATPRAPAAPPAAATTQAPAAPPAAAVAWLQRTITLPAHPRGFHLVTAEVLEALPELRELRVGLLHLLIAHTSASLALNESASPGVIAAAPLSNGT